MKREREKEKNVKFSLKENKNDVSKMCVFQNDWLPKESFSDLKKKTQNTGRNIAGSTLTSPRKKNGIIKENLCEVCCND